MSKEDNQKLKRHMKKYRKILIEEDVWKNFRG